MSIIALTGTIGSGKSTVARLLAGLGCKIVSADEIAREVVLPGSEGLRALLSQFGSQLVAADGSLIRSLLAEIIFKDKTARTTVEKILHPLIRTRAQFLLQESKVHTQLVVYDVPLFFETNLQHDPIFEKKVVVAAPRHLCIQRIIERDNITTQEATQRFDTQLPIAEKIALSSYTLYNCSTFEDLFNQTLLFHRWILTHE